MLLAYCYLAEGGGVNVGKRGVRVSRPLMYSRMAHLFLSFSTLSDLVGRTTWTSKRISRASLVDTFSQAIWHLDECHHPQKFFTPRETIDLPNTTRTLVAPEREDCSSVMKLLTFANLQSNIPRTWNVYGPFEIVRTSLELSFTETRFWRCYS